MDNSSLIAKVFPIDFPIDFSPLIFPLIFSHCLFFFSWILNIFPIVFSSDFPIEKSMGKFQSRVYPGMVGSAGVDKLCTFHESKLPLHPIPRALDYVGS